MEPKYQSWIDNHVRGDGYGKCREVSAAMAAAFTELMRVRGHYSCPDVGEREHWWCETADGVVVDPTAAQFPSKGAGAYIPLPEDGPEPVGRCICCGGLVYPDSKFARSICSERCAAEMVAYLEDEWQKDQLTQSRGSAVDVVPVPGESAENWRSRRA